ncbi:taste receptor type 2 member 13 [Saimiri boliviensis]|uniref:taste receptor type 2 member 13 n=1 Tax=Saimiri boliviensis TaxID=27679 RepID=UPI00193E7C51|nr:taste receptor type 2 member 13 [Saimiri boliviensis boliviensis]
MESVLQSIFTLIIIAEFIIGNLSNGFIVLINCIEWVSKRGLSSVDQILIILAISRIGLLWEILINWFVVLHHPARLTDGTALTIALFSWTVTNHFSLWLATILSIFYLLKISSFSCPAFLYLKWRVNKVILMILLGTLVFLFLNLIQINIHIKEWLYRCERNTSWNFSMSDFATLSVSVKFTMTMFSLTPFTVAFISFLLLIFSLWKHLQKMQLSYKGQRDPRTKAHINALKIVISFLLLYVSFCLSMFMSWLSEVYQKELLQMLCQTIGVFYPSSHSFLLILGNPKLRQASLSVAAKVWAKR